MRTPAVRRAFGRLASSSFSSSVFALTALLAGCTGQDTEAWTIDDPSRAPLVRPDTPGNGLMFNFEPADVVEAHGSAGGRFLVHFTRDGKNAVPAADVNADTVPDFVEEVASVYEEVLTKYHDELGFRAPVSDAGIADNGGDDRFDVYLVDFAGQGDGNYRDDACDNQDPQICAGYMVQENDFKGYGYPSTLIANRILGSHEFFHAVQSAYDNGQGSVIAEGSAVWATETFDPSLKDFEGFLPGYLDNPDRPLDKPLPGAVDPFSYGAGLYFEFLSEHYGVDTVRSLWERCENGANGVADPYWLTELGPLLAQENTTFADAMVDFATWNLFTKQYADPTRSYAASGGYPLLKMEDVTAPHFDDGLRVFYASAQYFRLNPDGRAEMTAAIVAPAAAPDETSDLRMLLATRAGNTYAPVKEVPDPTAGTETIDTASADKLVVVVVNTTTGGNSRKPALCIGTTDEVAACRAAFLGGGGTGGAGGTGGGGTGGSGGGGGIPGGGGGGTSGDDSGGCGCRTAGSSSPEEKGTFAAALALALALHRRRRATSR